MNFLILVFSVGNRGGGRMRKDRKEKIGVTARFKSL